MHINYDAIIILLYIIRHYNHNGMNIVMLLVKNECRADDHGNTPCQNGGVCTDLVKKYLCTCTGNFYGKNCQEEGILLHKVLLQAIGYH